MELFILAAIIELPIFFGLNCAPENRSIWWGVAPLVACLLINAAATYYAPMQGRSVYLQV